MSGFEGLQSRFTQLLHPRLDPNDKYDPTFLGVTRKRRGKAPDSQFVKEVKGKRIKAEMMSHSDVLTQLEQQCQPETFKGDTTVTRFGVGFARRSGATIASDFERRSEDEKKKESAVRLLEFRRDHFFERTRTNPLNPITGETPSAFRDALFPPQLAGHRAGKAVDPQKTVSQLVFNWTDASARQQQQAELPPRTKRQDTLAREGLSQPRNWSVGQQMHCGDGFVLPTLAKVT